jgi:hypothetical protein
MSRISSFLKDAGRFGLHAAFQAVTARYVTAPAVIDLPRYGRYHVRGRDSDIATLRQVFGEQEYRLKIPAIEARLEQRYRQMLAAGQVPVIIDAGANVGAAARWFHQAFPEARVIAVEPDAAPRLLAPFDPLVWWKERCHRYPTVAKLAMKYLAIPASTAPSERVFSTAKNILIKKRWRLDPGRLQRSIFLRHNHDFNPDAC